MSQKRGVTLVATIFIMLVVALLAITTSTFVASDATIAVRNYYSQDAFYIASAGLEFYQKQLLDDNDWSTPPTAKVRSFSGGTFVVTTTNESRNRITITVTGILTADARTYTRAIQPTLQRSGGGISDILNNYVIYWGGGGGTGSTIGNNSYLSGDIFINNNLEIGQNVTVSGDAQSTANIDIGENSDVTGTIEENTTPPYGTPTLETSWYDQLLTYAATGTAGNRSYSNQTLSGYYYVKGNVTFGGTINITGSATVVATGVVTVNNNTIFGDHLTVIASQDVHMANNVDVGNQGLWYSRTLIELGNNAEIADIHVGDGTAFITPGDVRFGNNVEFAGFIYAGGDLVQTGNNFYFQGNMIIGGDVTVDNNTTILLNPAVTDSNLMVGLGMTSGGSSDTVDLTGWDEVY